MNGREEVTDMQRSVKGEVVSSTFDEPAERHVQVAEMVIEKPSAWSSTAKMSASCAILTRLLAPQHDYASSGRVLSGGLDSTPCSARKRFFCAARIAKKGGSLTLSDRAG